MAADSIAERTDRIARRLGRFIAGLLSLLWPGVGQLYNASWRKALLFAAGLPLLGVLAAGLVLTIPFAGLNLLPLLLPAAVRLTAVIDAFKGARRAAPDRAYPWYSHTPVCTLLVLLYVFALGPTQATMLRNTVARAFAIHTGGMEPTVLVGDQLLVSSFAYGLRDPLSGADMLRGREPQRGDLIVFLGPGDPRRYFLKRVIGLPRETIEIRDHEVIIDGRSMRERYIRFPLSTRSPQHSDNWGPASVPVGHLFVMGDNRDNSRDSRHLGFIPIADVLGEAKVVYLSVAHPRGESPYSHLDRIRWDRFGKILR